jgi:sugar/nucleoside kinase (ribokinase family)
MKRFDLPEDQLIMVYLDSVSGDRIFAGVQCKEPLVLLPDDIDMEYLLEATYLHLDGRHPAASLVAARRMREKGNHVMLDGGATTRPIPQEVRELISQTTILICGTGFAPSLTQRDDLQDAGRACLDLGPELVVLTEGKAGCHTFTADEHYHIPAFDVRVADTTGAGDVFHGAYLAALMRGWDHHTAGVFSTAASAIKCSRLGGRKGFPSFDETLAFLEERGYDIPVGGHS